MKKFFALFMVSALLAVTGSAFAVTTPTAGNVTVKVGRSGTSTATATPTAGGNLSYTWTSDLAWMTFEGATATFSPGTYVQAGTYNATVTVNEDTVNDDVAGHHSFASTTITITVEPPEFATEITADPTYVSMQVGGSASSRIGSVATAGLNGYVTYILDNSGLSWITLSGPTVNFTNPPSATEAFSVTVKARETAGIYSNEGNEPSITITGKVTDGGKTEEQRAQEETTTGGSDVEETTTETRVSEIVDRIENISMTVLVGGEAITITLTDDEINSLYNVSMRDSVQAQTEMSDGDAQAYEVNTTRGVGTAMGSSATIASSTQYTASSSERGSNPTAMSKLLAEILDSRGVNVGENTEVAIVAFTVELNDNVEVLEGEQKVAAIPQLLDPKLHGAVLNGYVDKIRKNDTSNYGDVAASHIFGIHSAAVTDSDTMIFLNSKGERITRVPGLNNDGVVPGLITMVIPLERGVIHTPVVTVDNNSLPEEVKATPTQTEVEVIRRVSSTFTAQSNSFFSTMVSWDLISSTDLTNGYEYYRISDDAGGRVNSVRIGDDWTRTDEDNDAMTSHPSFDLTRVVRLPALIAENELEDHVYVVKVNFHVADELREKILASADNGAFVFFPNGPQRASARSRVTKAVNGQLVTMLPEELRDSDVTSGYLSFIIPAGETLEKPMLALRLRKTESEPEPGPGPGPEPGDEFYITPSATNVTVILGNSATVTYTPTNATGDVTYSVSPSADWVALVTTGNEAAVTVLPTNSALIASSPNVFTVTATDSAGNTASETLSITVTRRNAPGGSGGGCSAGFSAMALAVLGAFIARRKK